MFPTDVRFADSTMTVVDTPGVRAALLPLCQRGERFPEATMVERVIHRHGFTVEVLQGGMYAMEPARERSSTDELERMRRVLNALAPHLPSFGLDDHAPRMEWWAVDDDSGRLIWEVVAGVLCEHTEPPSEPTRFEYEYTVHHTVARRERLVLSAEKARELLADPLDPDPGDLEGARQAVEPCANEAMGDEPPEVQGASVTVKTF